MFCTQSQAGIAATARWSLAVPQESVEPAVLAVAKASAMQTAERRAAAQGTGADADADVLDEELGETARTRARAMVVA